MKDLGSLFECINFSDGLFGLALSKGIMDYEGCPINFRLEYLWSWVVMMTMIKTPTRTQVCMHKNLELGRNA
jgi:hypothetical protein